MITPTVGRQVWYRPSEYDKAGAGAMVAGQQPLAATICAVWGPRMVNLLVIDSNGKLFAKPSTTLLQEGDTPPAVTGGGGYAEWIQYLAAPVSPSHAPTVVAPDHQNRPAFNAAEKCSPMLTQCPRCNNPSNACDLGPLETGEADALPLPPHAVKPAAPFLTRAGLESLIVGEYYANGADFLPRDSAAFAQLHMGRLTVCILLLRNGYIVPGTSAPLSAANFDPEKGRQAARESAIDKLWPLEGYLRLEMLHQAETAGAGQ